MAVVPPRPDACPCGSGKLYRDCCGKAAFVSFKHGRLEDAEALCRQSLDLRPNDPDALRLLGGICHRTGRAVEAIRFFARALDAGPWPDAELLAALEPVLNAVFAGKTFGQAARLRRAHDDWKTALSARAPRHEPLVSVLVPLSENARDCSATLRSLFGQTYARLEIVVVADRREAIGQGLLDSSPFPVRLLVLSDGNMSARINQAVRHTTGECIGLLMPGDRFDARRIERMVSGVVHAGGEWGFSRFNLDTAGLKSAVFRDQLNRQLDGLLEGMRGHDTTGFALLDCINNLALPSNLFFSRRLFEALGGFADLSEATHKDFALRAVLEAEPFFVDEALLDYRLLEVAAGRARLESEQTRIALQEFYARAAGDKHPANTYAPVMPVWGAHFIARLAGAKRLHMLSREGIRKCLERAAQRLENQQEQGLQKVPGLDIVSFFGAEIGLADSARGLARSCRAGGIPFSARTVELESPYLRRDRSMDPWVEDACRHAAVLFHVNPDMLSRILPQFAAAETAGRYRIGYWYWETARMPEQWRYALDLLDEIWVATDFVAGAVRAFTDKPVVKIHPPVEVPSSLSFVRSDYGLDEGRFLFLFSFDFGSYSARKNPYAAIRAFMQAFPPARTDVGLVIKSQGGGQCPDRLAELLALIGPDPRIRLIDRRMHREEVYGMQGVCDAFVSLHRSEGLGLGLAECMAQGKAVIGTAYSGNLEFMNEANSCLVGYKPVPIRAGEYLYDQPGVAWAEPDIGEAARFMRRLVDDQAFSARIAVAGQAEIRQNWNFQATSDAIRRRLGELGLL